MRSIKRLRSKLNAMARLGYSIAGAALIALPALVAYREGVGGMRPEAVLAALFGIAYLIVATLGRKIGGGEDGPSAWR
jgi:hypothetical protein